METIMNIKTEEPVAENDSDIVREQYNMVAGEVVFKMNEPDAHMNALRLNCVVKTPDSRIAVKELARAQQALQMQFFQRMGTTELTVLDVVILAIMPLGWFTEEEFNATPAGSQIQAMDVGKTDSVSAQITH